MTQLVHPNVSPAHGESKSPDDLRAVLPQNACETRFDAVPGADVTDPVALLAAADAGAAHVRLDDELEGLVARALSSRERLALRAASLGCRVYERAYRARREPVPERLLRLLGDVRLALRAARGAT